MGRVSFNLMALLFGRRTPANRQGLGRHRSLAEPDARSLSRSFQSSYKPSSINPSNSQSRLHRYRPAITVHAQQDSESRGAVKWHSHWSCFPICHPRISHPRPSSIREDCFVWRCISAIAQYRQIEHHTTSNTLEVDGRRCHTTDTTPGWCRRRRWRYVYCSFSRNFQQQLNKYSHITDYTVSPKMRLA